MLENSIKILIPTDFTVTSLQLVEYAILNYPNTKLDIILIAGCRLPQNRMGVTHFSKREQLRTQMADGFEDAQRQILKEYKNNINTFSYELFTGVNSLAFQNFLEQLAADAAIIPSDKILHGQNKKWFNATNFIKKKVKHLIEVPLELLNEAAPYKKL